MSQTAAQQSQLIWSRLDRIGRRAWRFALLIGICKLVLVGGFVLLFAGVLDYFLQSAVFGTRLVVSILSLLAMLAGFVRWVLPVFRIRLSTAQIATYVERAIQLPDGWLSSVAEFREQTRQSGQRDSAELRQQAIVQAESLFSVTPLESAVDSRAAFRWLTVVSVASVAIGALCASYPQNTWIAMERLAQPWSTTAWPRNCELEFRGLPNIVSRGTDLEIVAINRLGKLPTDVRVQLRDSDGSNLQEFDMQTLNNQALFHIPQVNKSLELRATSSLDNRMAWHRIGVTKPPTLERFAFEISPPAYTEIASSEVTGQSIRVLAGSQIRMRGTFDELVDEIAIDDISWKQSPNSPGIGSAESPPDYASSLTNATEPNGPDLNERPSSPDSNWQLRLVSDKKEFVLESLNGDALVIQQSVRFGLRWKSSDGLIAKTPTAFDIEVTPDLPPVVTWAETSRSLAISPTANIPIQGSARDDLKLTDFFLNWEVSQSDGTRKSAGQSNIHELTPTGESTPLTIHSPSEMQSQGWWQAPDCMPGDSVTVWLSAVDSAGQTGETNKQTLSVSAPSDLIAELANTQFDVSQSIRQSVARQRQSKAALSQFIDVLNSKNQLQSEDRQAMATAVLQQEAANRWLDDERDGAINRLESLADRLKQNGLQDSELAEQTNATLEQLYDVRQNLTDPSIQELRSAQAKLSEDNLPPTAAADLAKIVDNQSNIETKLDEILAQLGQQATVRDYLQQLRAIAQQQDETLNDTNQLTALIVSGNDLAVLENQRIRIQSLQREIARRLDQVITDTGNSTQADSESNAASTQEIAELKKRLIASGLSQLMRQSADLLSAINKTQQSAEIQVEVVEKLLEIIGSNESEQGKTPSQMADRLNAIAQQLQNIANQQSDLADAIRQGTIDPANATSRQSALNQQTNKQSQALDRLGQAAASDSLRSASEKQSAAVQELSDNKSQDAANSAQEAADQIQQSAEAVNQSAASANQEVLENELMLLSAAVDRILPQQSELVERIVQIDAKKEAAEATQEKRNVAAMQDNLRSSLENAKPKLPSTAAFAFATQMAIDSMRRAAIATDRDPDLANSLRQAKSAAERLRAIQAALKDEASTSPTEPQEAESDEEQQEDTESTPLMKSLLLLRAIQTDVRDRVTEIKTTVGEGKLSAQQWLEVNELAHQQESLAQQVQQLLNQNKKP